MWKSRILALIVLVVGLGIGSFDYASQSATSRWLNFPFKLGLDLSGGTHLVYEADTTRISDLDIPDAMTSLRGVIERRVNLYGVSEPIVQVEGALSGGENARLIVELPGVTDIDAAIKLIDKTPNLEFKTERPDGSEKDTIVAAYEAAQEVIDAGGTVDVEKNPLLKEDPRYVSTALTGRYLKRAQVSFNQNSINPSVAIEFNSEGAKLFRDMTEANVGKSIAIYLDGVPISEPTVNEAIKDGRAEISGNFNTDTAKSLARDLNLGALPVPIKLISTQTIGATLGDDAVTKGVTAAFYGFVTIAVFLFLLFRPPRVPSFFALVALGAPDARRSTRVITIAENMEVSTPSAKVSAKPSIKLSPNQKRITAVIKPETLESRMESHARRNPSSIASRSSLPRRSSSFMRSKIRTLASTARPMERIKPAMPAEVSVTGTSL